MAGMGEGDVADQNHLARTIESEFWYFAKEEASFVVSEELTNGSTGATSAVSMSNPTDSGVTGVFALVQVSVQAPSYVRLYDRFDSGPSGGTEATVSNVLLDSAGGAPDAGAVSALADPTYSATSTHVAEVLGGGRGGNAVGGAVDVPVAALEPGRDLVIEVEKIVSDGDNATITVQWYEAPTVFSERAQPRPPDVIYD